MAIRLVAIEQRADDWHRAIVEACGKCWELALYDDAEATYCCEMTPSRLLYPLCYEFERGFDDGEQPAALTVLGITSMTDLEWCDLPDPYYMHARVVDNLPHLTWGAPDETEADQLEAAREHWQGNVPGVAEVMAGSNA